MRISDWSSDVCSSDLISHCWIFDTIPEKHDVIVSEHLDDEAARPPLQEVCRAEVCCRQNQPPVVGCLVQLSVEIHQPTEGLRLSRWQCRSNVWQKEIGRASFRERVCQDEEI